jgi:ornithine carbamoyltransferase
MGERETVRDCAKNLERFTDIIVARTFSHTTIEELAANASVPVINALSDRFHPCQALADVLTVAEHFPDRTFADLSVAYVGDGNNVCHSLMLACAILGMKLAVITPPGFEPAEDVVLRAQSLARQSGAALALSNDVEAVAGHDAIYTDTWVSMGSEAETQNRLAVFAPYQVTQRVMHAAGPNAIFMHCLPAYRGKEVAAEVIDGPQSVVFDQAENRMHAQNALLAHLLADESRAAVSSPEMMWPDVIGAPSLS